MPESALLFFYFFFVSPGPVRSPRRVCVLGSIERCHIFWLLIPLCSSSPDLPFSTPTSLHPQSLFFFLSFFQLLDPLSRHRPSTLSIAQSLSVPPSLPSLTHSFFIKPDQPTLVPVIPLIHRPLSHSASTLQFSSANSLLLHIVNTLSFQPFFSPFIVRLLYTSVCLYLRVTHWSQNHRLAGNSSSTILPFFFIPRGCDLVTPFVWDCSAAFDRPLRFVVRSSCH